MRTVRSACFAALIGIFPASLLPVGYAWGQETASEAAPTPAAADSKPTGAKKRGAAAGKANATAAKPAAARPATDRLNLDATKVMGNRELPKVLYIVPWKRADLVDLPGQPINSLLDEVLAPLDRDEYRREIRYYQTITAPADQRPEAASPVSQSTPTEK